MVSKQIWRRRDGMNLTKKDQQSLEEFFLSRIETEDKEPDCRMCEDTNSVDCFELDGGRKVESLTEMRAIAKMRGYSIIDIYPKPGGWVRSHTVKNPCPYCKPQRIQKLIERYGIRSKGDVVTLEVIEAAKKLVKLNFDPADVAKRIPKHSTLLFGPTETFKTLILSYWYNRILNDKEGDPRSLRYLREKELIEILTSEESHKFLKSLDNGEIEFLFLDEIFYPANWINQNEGGYKNAIQFSSMMDFWDTCYTNRKGKLTVFATSNKSPEQAIVDNDALMRRADDVFLGKDRKKPGRIELG